MQTILKNKLMWLNISIQALFLTALYLDVTSFHIVFSGNTYIELMLNKWGLPSTLLVSASLTIYQETEHWKRMEKNAKTVLLVVATGISIATGVKLWTIYIQILEFSSNFTKELTDVVMKTKQFAITFNHGVNSSQAAIKGYLENISENNTEIATKILNASAEKYAKMLVKHGAEFTKNVIDADAAASNLILPPKPPGFFTKLGNLAYDVSAGSLNYMIDNPKVVLGVGAAVVTVWACWYFGLFAGSFLEAGKQTNIAVGAVAENVAVLQESHSAFVLATNTGLGELVVANAANATDIVKGFGHVYQLQAKFAEYITVSAIKDATLLEIFKVSRLTATESQLAILSDAAVKIGTIVKFF